MASTSEKIWAFFKSKGLTPAGIAGLMGNLYYESGLNPKNLQNTYNSSLGYTDEAYTKAVDNKTYTNFIYDSAGYGLAQWTYWSRKRKLLNYANKKKQSIGNLDMQLNFLYNELSDSYSGVLSVLKSTTSVRVASDKVLLNFEKPADQSNSVKQKRAAKSVEYYNKYSDSTYTYESTDIEDSIDDDYVTQTVQLKDLIGLESLYQYTITIDRNTRDNLNLSLLTKKLNVKGALVEGGYLYKSNHTKVSDKDFANPKLHKHIPQLAKIKMPWGIYMISRAQNMKEALLEVNSLYYVLNEWTPELGVWIVPNWTNNKTANDSIMNAFYDKLREFGFTGKIGIMATKSQLDKLNWESQCSKWFLWWVSHTSVNEYKDEIVTPEFFMLNDGKNNPQPVTIRTKN